MNAKFETMVFSIEDYKWQNTDEEARTEMWKDIATTLKILMKNSYQAVVRDDDCDIIVIEYNHDNRRVPLGNAQPVWLYDDEYCLVGADEEEVI